MAEPGEPLTERELEILRYVATGASNKEIAHRLHISTNTVKVHLRNIFTKLEVVSRTEATMVAVRRGWVAVGEVRTVSEEEPGAEALQAPITAPAAPEPPLPWYRRVFLMVAALIALAAAALAWPRPVPSAPPAAGVLPSRSEAATMSAGRRAASRWVERAQMPTRRAWLAATAWERRLLAIGGETPEGITDAVEIYDPATDTWARGTPKPTPAAYIGAAVLGNRVFVPGGCTADGAALSVLEVYDPAADTWATAASLPRPLCGYALAVYGDRLYLFGGTDGRAYLDTVYAYDPQANRWEEQATMPIAQALAAAAPLENAVYVVGGYRAGQEQTTCAVYHPARRTWSSCAPLTLPRGGLGLIPFSGQLYAVGGGGWGGYLGFNERYDPAQARWMPVETPLLGEWHGVGVVLVDLTIYAVGGYSDDYLSLTLAFEPLPFRIFIPATER
ncbi:MAG: kelch repeat-containing protein [Anaerolineae bacterium]|nr:LuxR C-terminal-related transcriptional regulator [Anaerolineae bacterium]MDW8067299.1 kelch repeat-containing protein [Anaerolineae bacterium]